MDPMVKAAMAKWPHVPDCYGWLGLDARGRWWMRDDQAQSHGPFAGPGSSRLSRGSELKHEQLIAFIQRNYEVNERGCWFFQNGPQRVFVELEQAPWIWRLETPDTLQSHTGYVVTCQAVYVSEAGRLYASSERGWGVVHTQDMHQAAEWIEAGLWEPREIEEDRLQALGGFVLSPQALQRQGVDGALSRK